MPDEYVIDDFQSQHVISNFELTIINAVDAAYPDTDVYLCFFYLTQSAFQKITDLGLRNLYIEDPILRDIIHIVADLAFVPIDNVKRAFRVLTLQASNNPNVEAFNSYFDKMYVNGTPGGARRRQVPPRNEPST